MYALSIAFGQLNKPAKLLFTVIPMCVPFTDLTYFAKELLCVYSCVEVQYLCLYLLLFHSIDRHSSVSEITHLTYYDLKVM